jgi:hypothetical protein
MSQDQTSDPTESNEPTADDAAEAPDADVMRAVAEALEATDSGGEAATITRVASAEADPLLPRRGS